MNESELKSLLENRSVSIAEWGKGQAKTLGHLLKEIEAGETVLEIKTDDQLLRRTAFLAIEVLYKDEIKCKRYKLIEETQVFTDGRQAKRDEENGKLNPSNLSDLRSHFRSKYNNGNQYPWTIGGQDITCDLGVGFMAYHNGADGATVWDKCVVILIHEEQAYISDPIYIELVAHDNFYLSEVKGREVVGNKFKVGFVCRRYDSWAGNHRPTFVEFELTL